MAAYNERLVQLRESRGLSQAVVAGHLGCATYTYQRYEYGQFQLPGDKLILLSQFYGVSTDYILGLTDNKSPK